jgi:adenosylcobinamide amidohydrolase
VKTKLNLKGRWLEAVFEKPQSILSWAPQGGGRVQAQAVAWYQVTKEDLRPPVDADGFLKRIASDNGMSEAVVMLTSADLSHYQDIVRTCEGIEVRCVATVGMTNALRIGDPPSVIKEAGTINLLCSVSIPLSYSAMVEALSVAVEARTAAVMDADLPSIQTGRPATGTGTDCAALACPAEDGRLTYAGKHTALGSLIGDAVYQAVASGLKTWKQKSSNKEVLI